MSSIKFQLPSSAASPSECLLAAAWAGDQSVFYKAAAPYQPYLINVARRILPRHLAGDAGAVVHDGLVAAAQHLGQARRENGPQLLAWLARIVRNKACDFAKGQWREPSLQADSDFEAVPDDGSTPSQHACRREEAARVSAFLARLSEPHQQVLHLRHIENRTFAEIADIMKRSTVAVRQLWVRAVQALSEEMGEQK